MISKLKTISKVAMSPDLGDKIHTDTERDLEFMTPSAYWAPMLKTYHAKVA